VAMPINKLHNEFCPPNPYRLLAQKSTKLKSASTFPKTGITGLPIFSFRGQADGCTLLELGRQFSSCPAIQQLHDKWPVSSSFISMLQLPRERIAAHIRSKSDIFQTGRS